MTFTNQQAELVHDFMAAHDIPGVAVAVVADGRIVAEGGFGMADIARQSPATEHTRWPICSLTKAFTGTAAMQLVEQGKLRLDEPVVSYLPDFRVRDKAVSDAMTVRLFLRHNSGLGRTGHQDRLREVTVGNHYPTRETLVKALSDADLQSRPGACWSYSNEGYVVAGRVISVLAEKPLEEVFEEDIFARVGMTETSTRFADWRAAEDRMSPYSKGDMGAFDSGEKHGDGYVVVRLPQDYQTFLATGGIISTAHDLALFQLASMDYTDSPLLCAGSLDHAQSVQFPFGDTGWGYGFGWQVFWSEGTKVVGHAGGLPGVSTYSMMVPSERTSVVVLTNRGERKAFLLAEALLGDLRDKPLFRQSADHPLPFRTKFKPAPEVLTRVSGEYERNSTVAKVSQDGDCLRLQLPPARGASYIDACLTAIGADTFLEQQFAQILHFVRDADSRPVRLLWGGYAYERRRA